MKRTAVYSAEEKALMVMLEGEQEEEKRREREKQVKKERERQLHRKHTVDVMLFGGKTSQQKDSICPLTYDEMKNICMVL